MQSTESIWVLRKSSPIGASQKYCSSGDCHPGYKMLLFKTSNQTVINNYWLKKISICPLLGVNTHCLAIAFTCIIYNYIIYLIYLDFIGTSILGVWNPHQPALEYPLRSSPRSGASRPHCRCRSAPRKHRVNCKSYQRRWDQNFTTWYNHCYITKNCGCAAKANGGYWRCIRSLVKKLLVSRWPKLDFKQPSDNAAWSFPKLDRTICSSPWPSSLAKVSRLPTELSSPQNPLGSAGVVETTSYRSQ